MNRILTTIMLLALVALSACSSTGDAAGIDPDRYYEDVDTPPQIVGGLSAIAKVLDYPDIAIREGVQGTVIILAYIGTDGKVEKTEVAKSDSELLSKAALDAVKLVDFEPGEKAGTVVKTRVAVPVKFRLN